MVTLQQVSISNTKYQNIRNRHYVDNNGIIGRQIHHLIFLNGDEFGEQPIGIISGSSCVYCCKPRDEFFGINKENRIEKIGQIINNAVFRLEHNEPNLGSRILSIWRKQVVKDWYKQYKINPIGFETFVYGESRHGTVYKADNWKHVGMTSGFARKTLGGIEDKTRMRHIPTNKKLIFCKNI